MFITVPIVCIAEDMEDAELSNIKELFDRLSIHIPENGEKPKTEIRFGDINTEFVAMYYPANNVGKTLVEMTSGKCIIVNLALNDFRELMHGKKAKDTGTNCG